MTINSNNLKSVPSLLGNMLLQLGEASGPIVAIELRMRLLGEYSPEVQEKLKQLAVKPGKKNYDYYNCKLNFLEDAILEVFGSHFSQENLNKIKKFRPIRNALLHGDFVSLAKEMDVMPEGRHIERDGKRNTLQRSELYESILAIDRMKVLGTCQTKAKEIADIFDDFFRNTELSRFPRKRELEPNLLM